MAIYPALFGHVELPDVESRREDRERRREIGVRVVRPAAAPAPERRSRREERS
jgi:hypothetical protein